MTTVIGLGNAGCNIVDLLSQYSQYSCYKFDVGLKKGKYSFPLRASENLEDYERKMPSPRSFLREVDEDIIFVMSGGGKVSSCALRILEAIKKKKIKILYIRPELTLLSETQATLERMTYGIFQEYARSGLFDELILVSNSEVDRILGGLTIKEYQSGINQTIASTLHMINVYKNVEPLVSTFDKKPNGVRISTMGVCDPTSGEEKMFFSLDNISDIEYYYAYDKKEIETNKNLLSEVKININEKKEVTKRVTYGVYETDYEQNYLYCIHGTSIIQQ
jgi:hypothetical protein